MTIRQYLTVLLMATVTAVGAQQHRSDAVDDVLQHLPMASVFIVKGCSPAATSSSWTELVLTAAASYTVAAATTWSAKELVSERRPDGSNHRSFPSGHATFAFAGATMLHHEYGHLSPWITIGGYGLATFTAADRVLRDRHYLHDVCAGAAIGIAATELSYFVRRRLIKNDKIDLTFSGQALHLALHW